MHAMSNGLLAAKRHKCRHDRVVFRFSMFSLFRFIKRSSVNWIEQFYCFQLLIRWCGCLCLRFLSLFFSVYWFYFEVALWFPTCGIACFVQNQWVGVLCMPPLLPSNGIMSFFYALIWFIVALLVCVRIAFDVCVPLTKEATECPWAAVLSGMR